MRQLHLAVLLLRVMNLYLPLGIADNILEHQLCVGVVIFCESFSRSGYFALNVG